MKVGIASDHAGFSLKAAIIDRLQDLSFKDFGAPSEERADYPDFGHPLAREVADGTLSWGIAICGSGQGMNMTVNKHHAIRGALCWNAEIVKLAREHNDANILVLPARFITVDEALNMIHIFMNTAFEGGRHQPRIEKIHG